MEGLLSTGPTPSSFSTDEDAGNVGNDVVDVVIWLFQNKKKKSR